MAHVTSKSHGNISSLTPTPFMDRLTHEVIKETSKSLRHYFDVKRRENAFILNPNSTAVDNVPFKARFMYGTTKEYPPLYGSYYSDNDLKVYLRSFQQQQRQLHSTENSPEKQMCREELNYHMRVPRYLPKESQKFAELRLAPMPRSTSSCSRLTIGSDNRCRISKSTHRSPRNEKDHLINDAADILATMVKTRRTIYQTNLLSQQSQANYISRNIHSSPRQNNDQFQPQARPSSPTPEQSRRSKRTTENVLEKAASIMYNAKPIENGLLCEYKISVITGNCNGASTTAPIHIKLYGTNGHTNFLHLVDSETHRIPFKKNQTDVFHIQTYHVGQLAGITIGHDRIDIRSAWFLDRVIIEDPIREMTFEIPCNAWLSTTSNDQKTMRDLQVTSMISHKKHRREDKDSQSSSSIRSIRTNRSDNEQLQQTKKHHKDRQQQQRVSMTQQKSKTLSEITDDLSQIPPSTTVESHFNPNEFSSPSVPPVRRMYSPNLSSSSSEIELEEALPNGSRSTTPILNQSPRRANFERSTSQTTNSTINERPPARLENRRSPISSSPERPLKNKEDTHSFFED